MAQKAVQSTPLQKCKFCRVSLCRAQKLILSGLSLNCLERMEKPLLVGRLMAAFACGGLSSPRQWPRYVARVYRPCRSAGFILTAQIGTASHGLVVRVIARVQKPGVCAGTVNYKFRHRRILTGWGTLQGLSAGSPHHPSSLTMRHPHYAWAQRMGKPCFPEKSTVRTGPHCRT